MGGLRQNQSRCGRLKVLHERVEKHKRGVSRICEQAGGTYLDADFEEKICCFEREEWFDGESPNPTRQR